MDKPRGFRLPQLLSRPRRGGIASQGAVDNATPVMGQPQKIRKGPGKAWQHADLVPQSQVLQLEGRVNERSNADRQLGQEK
jgi:hypothetical protein